MAENNLPNIKRDKPTQEDYFSNFYGTQSPINGAKYDAVYTFFLARTSNNSEAAKSLTASLLEITYTTGVDPMSVLEDFKKYNQNESFRTALIGLFNSSRRNTSKLGFSSNPTPVPTVLRNVRS